MNFAVAVVLMFKMYYNNRAISRRNDRSRKGRALSDEESPGFTGQDAGQRPVEVTPRQVQQK